MHWDKSPPAAEVRPRPYQGVRVKDPVKELLRRKRSAAASGSRTAASTLELGRFTAQTGLSSSESLSEGCSGWRALPWPPPDSGPQEPPAQGPSSTGPHLGSGPDLYMPTLCPSYTMLTYAHGPLLTNFGTIPVAPVPAPLPQLDSDSGLTYLPWTAVSAPATLPGSPMLHVPLSMSLATVVPQLDVQGPEPSTATQSQAEPEAEEKHEAPSLLDRLLEEHKAQDGDDEDSYNGSIFGTDV